MSDLMQQFVRIGRLMPDKRDAERRLDDFGEIYGDYSTTGAAEQASRCEQCGIPYC